MKSNRVVTVAVVAAALCLASWAVTKANDALTAKPTAVAVVDLSSLFANLKEKSRIEADLKAQLERINEETEKRKTALRAMNEDLNILAPETPAYQQKQNDLERGVIELQAWKQFEENKLNRERAMQIEGLYRKMIDAIGQTAKQSGRDIVLFKEQSLDLSKVKPEDLLRFIEIRKVLWSADELDLTEQVVQKMNNEYANMTP